MLTVGPAYSMSVARTTRHLREFHWLQQWREGRRQSDTNQKLVASPLYRVKSCRRSRGIQISGRITKSSQPTLELWTLLGGEIRFGSSLANLRGGRRQRRGSQGIERPGRTVSDAGPVR